MVEQLTSLDAVKCVRRSVALCLIWSWVSTVPVKCEQAVTVPQQPTFQISVTEATDGVPFNSTSDGQFDPAQISAESIREIKVSYGGSSVLYGDNAVAGVVEVLTEAPREGLHGGFTADLGTPDQRDVSGRLSSTHGKINLLLTGLKRALSPDWICD